MLDSRYLAYILRHHPEEVGLTLDKEGWCNVDDLLDALNIYIDELEEVVNNNTRYIFNDNKTKIKAAHGHSVKVEYKNEKTPPEFLYHGTNKRLYDVIKKEGLKKMTREAVHMSEYYDDAKRIGSRHAGGSLAMTIVFKIKAFEMYKAGFKFYKSEDGVWLTDHVPGKYLSL